MRSDTHEVMEKRVQDPPETAAQFGTGSHSSLKICYREEPGLNEDWDPGSELSCCVAKRLSSFDEDEVVVIARAKLPTRP